MYPLDFEDFFLLAFYIVTTLLQLYFLWTISDSLKTLTQKREKE